jgi:hypothetical protein
VRSRQKARGPSQIDRTRVEQHRGADDQGGRSKKNEKDGVEDIGRDKVHWDWVLMPREETRNDAEWSGPGHDKNEFACGLQGIFP